MHLRIQIPARNEAATLAHTVTQAVAQAAAVLHRSDRLSVLIVDDGSTDATPAICADLSSRDPRVRTLRRSRSVGLGAAFRAGVRCAQRDSVDVLLHLDGDGQHDPADLSVILLPALNGDADLVLGSRFSATGLSEREIGWLARVGNHALSSAVSWASGQQLADVSCGLRAFGPRAMRSMVDLRADYTYTHESVLLAAAAGLHIVEVAITVAGRRAHGRSRLIAGPVRHALRCACVIAATRVRVGGRRASSLAMPAPAWPRHVDDDQRVPS